MPGDDSWNSDWKEIFTLYDEKNDGTIDPKDFGTVYRALGQNPSEKEIATIVKELSPGGERIAFSAFEKAAKENMATPIDAETLADLFKVMDPDGTGVVSVSELTELLTTLSEPLEKPKAIQLLQKYGKEVKYADFIADLLKAI